MELAAIASAAVPGLAPTGVTGAPDDAADFDSALLVDAAGKQWRVRSPRHPEASMRLETELQALRAFTPAVKAELPFLIPHIAGSVRQGNLSTFVYSHLEGSTRDLGSLAAAGRPMAAELGRVLAAIHDLPQDLVQQANLPSYEANEFRQRKLNELDQAATTGRIPPILLRRWEHALEDVTLWRFSPTVVHGDLHEDHLLIARGKVSAVTGWTDLRIGDPADDFAWLAAVEDSGFVEAVYAAYAEARTTSVDPHIARRAALAAEFALAQWLVRGLAMEDRQMIAEAQEMMSILEADVREIELAQHEAPPAAAPAASGPAGGARTEGGKNVPHAGLRSGATLLPPTGEAPAPSKDAPSGADRPDAGSSPADPAAPSAAAASPGIAGIAGSAGGTGAAGPEDDGLPAPAEPSPRATVVGTVHDDNPLDDAAFGGGAYSPSVSGRAGGSSAVTVLRPGTAGSANDTETTALPIVSSRS